MRWQWSLTRKSTFVEVIGGIEPARELIVAALSAGKPVVTEIKNSANHGAELLNLQTSNGVDLLFEAAVAGVFRCSTVGKAFEAAGVEGMELNGTTNYILSKMTNEVLTTNALAGAQRLGYAERDPTADVEGFDAGAKAAIIASIAGVKVVAECLPEGISNITASDIAIAGRSSYVVKLLGIAEQDRDTGEVAVRVHPAMVPNEHPLASVGFIQRSVCRR